MSQRDARNLSPAAQEDLRRRVMSALDEAAQAARTIKVSRQAIYNWKARIDEGGRRALDARALSQPFPPRAHDTTLGVISPKYLPSASSSPSRVDHDSLLSNRLLSWAWTDIGKRRGRASLASCFAPAGTLNVSPDRASTRFGNLSP